MRIEVIAEIGKNFVTTERPAKESWLLECAKKFIITAKECGADTAKFQVHNYEDEVHPEAKITSPHFDQDRYEWVKRNTYSEEFWFSLKEYCREVGINFLATPMSRGAAELLDEVGVDRWKIGSGDILDFVMLDYIRDSGKPVILSSGMSSFEELKLAYDYLREKTLEVSILHCVSSYPCQIEDLNLNTIPFLKKQFPKVKIGFSDHSLGIDGAVGAWILGAEIIEKHFTLDRDFFGPDHKVSMLPNEMKILTNILHSKDATLEIDIDEELFKEALGVETKYLQKGEEAYRPIFRKGLFAGRNISKDEMFEPDMIYALRPKGDALPSEKYPELLDKFAERSYRQYEPL